MSNKWFNIRIKADAAGVKKLAGRVQSYPRDEFNRKYFPLLQQIMGEAADVGRNYIEFNPAVRTKTGEDRKAHGGNGPGRVDTGRMRDSFKFDSRRKVVFGDRYRFYVGFTGDPGYSLFQEFGTAHGIVGMDALGFTREFIRGQIKELKKYGSR